MNEQPTNEQAGAQTSGSTATSGTSFLQRLSRRRIAFFAKHEALFLWLMAPPILIFGLVLLGMFIWWLSGQGAALESILNGRWVPG